MNWQTGQTQNLPKLGVQGFEGVVRQGPTSPVVVVEPYERIYPLRFMIRQRGNPSALALAIPSPDENFLITRPA